jgi:hypothetical protein
MYQTSIIAASRFCFVVALIVTVQLSPWLVTAARAQGDAGGAAPRTGPLSGYMDFHFNNIQDEDPILDFHRFVLLFSHSFTDRIRFIGELELEHALVEGLEEAGELELEQAYIDFLITRAFNLRAGMLLTPMGIINERHEPPVFNGVERPFVDTVIVPTTWFDTGAGIHGELGHRVRYRAYVMAPLDALEFSADEGIRGGLQKGSRSNIRHPAFAARAEYVGTPGLTAGASVWAGRSSFAVPRLGPSVRIGEADARYQRGRLELRGQFAHVTITDAARLNDAVERLVGVSPNVARALRGFYGEAAYRLWDAGAPKDLVAFVRYENFDTQFRMPAGFTPLEEFDRDAWVMGVTYYPDPDVAVKADYIVQRNRSDLVRAPNSFNAGLGWWF